VTRPGCPQEIGGDVGHALSVTYIYIEAGAENIYIRIIHAFKAVDQRTTRQGNFAFVPAQARRGAAGQNRHPKFKGDDVTGRPAAPDGQELGKMGIVTGGCMHKFRKRLVSSSRAADCLGRGGRTRMHFQLFEDCLEMPLNGVGRDNQRLGDLLVGQTLCQ
jgi:hypothetical protein